MAEERLTRSRGDGWWFAGIATVLSAFWLVPYAVRGFSMPIGPDVPVYLWWARLAEVQGVGAAGHRPGATVVLVTLSNALHVPTLALIGGLLLVVGVSLALAGGLLLRAAGLERRTWVLGAVLMGFYARFLLWGYLANLLFALLFVAALVVVVDRDVRGLRPACLLFAAAGLAHPYFFVLGAAIVVLTAIGERVRDKQALSAPATTALRATVAGGLVAGVGVASTFLGPQYSLNLAPDAILRESGLRSLLPETYRIQFGALARSDGSWLLVEALLAIFARLGGFVGRLLGSWAFVAAVLLPVTLLLPFFATQRLVLFGYFLPLLAAVGLFRLTERSSTVVRRLVIACVVGLVVFEAAGWWWRITPFLTESQLAQSNAAAQLVAGSEPGTPAVIVVSQEGREMVLQAKALNAVRATVPPERIPDVFAYFGPVDDVIQGASSATEEPLRTLQRAAIAEIEATGTEPMIVVLTEFNDDAGARAAPMQQIAPGVFADRTSPLARVASLPTPPGPWTIVVAGIVAATILTVVGSGWSRWSELDRASRWAIAPAFGVAAVIVLGMALAAIGVELTGLAAAVVIVGAGGLGWLTPTARRGRRAPSLEADT